MANVRVWRYLVAFVVLALTALAPHLAPVQAAPPPPAPPRPAPVWREPWGHPTPTTWIEGESWVTQLTPAQQRALLGVPVEAVEAEWRQAQAHLSAPRAAQVFNYPPHLDWRSLHGHDWTTSVKSQGLCNSCAAFATVAAIESRKKINENTPDAFPDLSEAHLFFCSEQQCGKGWSLADALGNAADRGVTTESCYPYVGRDQACAPCADWAAQITQPELADVAYGPDELKQRVAEAGPVTVDFGVYEDFYRYRAGVYQHTWGGLAGYHAAVIVGYNDCGKYWIAKNSWGRGWGEDGFFRIAYGDADFEDYGLVPVMGGSGAADCTPNSGEAALYSEPNYGGRCRVLHAGSYPSWYMLQPVENDGTRSIRVGDHVTVTLYVDSDFYGLAEVFTADDPDLLDNPIGDQTSSVTVEWRGRLPFLTDDDYGPGCAYLPDIHN